jgi:hypothetical protein
MAKKQSFHDWEARILRSAINTHRYNRATRGLTLDPGEKIAATARAKRTSSIEAALRRSIQQAAWTKSKNQGPRRRLK